MTGMLSKKALAKLRQAREYELENTSVPDAAMAEIAEEGSIALPENDAETFVLPSDEAGRQLTRLRRASEEMADERVNTLQLSRADLKSRDEFVREIRVLWEATKERFLLIGEYLIVAKGILPRGEYEAMIDRDLPFSPSVARQLKAVAYAVRYQQPPLCSEADLPSSYSIAYQLTTLEPVELEAAKSEGLLHPALKRSEIIDFKKRLRHKVRVPTGGTVIPDAPPSVTEEVQGLLDERERLQARLLEIEHRLNELKAEREPA